jgi:glutaminyl-peptide cyclotransferase
MASTSLGYLETRRGVKLTFCFLRSRKMIFKTRLVTLFTLVANNANLFSGGVLVLFLSLSALGCRTGEVANLAPERVADNKRAPSYGFEVVHTWPHDPDAFTQGLAFHDGNLLESTGQEGRSSLRLVEIETGTILKKVDVPSPYFAEGITLLNGKIYQLTWLNQRGFIYDASTFNKLGEFSYTGEGWGLTNDGQSLILSDGTNQIRFLNPDNFQVRRTIAVTDGSRPVNEINELEYIHGEIYANIWHGERIARIDVQTGRVVGWIDLKGLLSQIEVHDEEAVLNGIAYDEMNGRLFVTGKLWPKLFEIKVIQR